ncbi:hypothetical protein D3C86_1504790 [compost metagenome]
MAAAAGQAEHEIGAPEPFIEQRHGVVGDLLQKLIGQAHFAASIGTQLCIQNHVRTHIHQRHQAQHGKRSLAISRGVSRAEMVS